MADLTQAKTRVVIAGAGARNRPGEFDGKAAVVDTGSQAYFKNPRTRYPRKLTRR